MAKGFIKMDTFATRTAVIAALLIIIAAPVALAAPVEQIVFYVH
jgi:hypothetical protein